MPRKIFNQASHPNILEGLDVWNRYLSTQHPTINTLQVILGELNHPRNIEPEYLHSEQVKGHIENVIALVDSAILRQRQTIDSNEIGNESFQREEQEEEHIKSKKLHQQRRKERASHEGEAWHEKQQAKEKNKMQNKEQYQQKEPETVRKDKQKQVGGKTETPNPFRKKKQR